MTNNIKTWLWIVGFLLLGVIDARVEILDLQSGKLWLAALTVVFTLFLVTYAVSLLRTEAPIINVTFPNNNPSDHA